jgi:hypothetical protein
MFGSAWHATVKHTWGSTLVDLGITLARVDAIHRCEYNLVLIFVSQRRPTTVPLGVSQPFHCPCTILGPCCSSSREESSTSADSRM